MNTDYPTTHFNYNNDFLHQFNLFKNDFTIQFAPLEKTSLYKKRGIVPPEMQNDYATFDYTDDIHNEITWPANHFTLPGHLTTQEIQLLDQTNDSLQNHYNQNMYGLIQESY